MAMMAADADRNEFGYGMSRVIDNNHNNNTLAINNGGAGGLMSARGGLIMEGAQGNTDLDDFDTGDFKRKGSRPTTVG